MTLIDLDAARKGRGPTTVRFAGSDYQIVGLPLLAIAAFQSGDLEAAVQALFGKHAKKVMDAGLGIEDLAAIVEGLAGGLGNLLASPGSSPAGQT